MDKFESALSQNQTAWGQSISEERLNELEQMWAIWNHAGEDTDKDDQHIGEKFTGADIFWLTAIAFFHRFKWRHESIDETARDIRADAIQKLSLRSFGPPNLYLNGAHLDTEHLEYAYLQHCRLAGAKINDAYLEWADLSNTDLTKADLTQAHLYKASLVQASLSEAELDRACLALANLDAAHLEGTSLRSARLWQADLKEAHLEGCDLTGAFLAGADLRETYFDTSTKLNMVSMFGSEYGAAQVADAHWGDVNLAVVDWTPFTELKWKLHWPFRAGNLIGDEMIARRKIIQSAKPYTPQARKQEQQQHIADFKQAARANRQLAIVLRNQGLSEESDYFAYRAQVSQRATFYYQRAWGPWIFSLILCLLAGYGYKPLRTLIAYLTVLIGFSIAYHAASPSAIGIGEAFVLSVSAFHGRGFFQPISQLGDLISVMAAIEAVFGLIIEASFIATFTQRFFGR